MVASSLAGCMGTDDSADDSAVTELENEITMQDEKIAELEAEIATLTTQHQDAVAELATVQSTLQSTQTSLDSAEANATMHQAEISSLEVERDMAQAELSMLYGLMSNMSDQSNETFESMALQIAELNQHMSNLSSMLNESYDRHQENATLVSQLTAERDNLQVALEQANNTIAGYIQDIVDAATNAQALAELQDHVHGILGANALDPKTNGDPQVAITNNGLSTQFTYTSNISQEHTIYVEFCNSSFPAFTSEIFAAATNLSWTELDPYSGDYVEFFATRYHEIYQADFGPTGCFVLQTTVLQDQFNATFSYQNLNLFDMSQWYDGEVEFYVSVCIKYECPLSDDWRLPFDGNFENIMPHYLMGGDVIPVSITGEMPCTLGFVTSAGGTCQPPACTDSFYELGSGTYVLDCEVVLIHEAYSKTTNSTLLNASTIFFMQGSSGNSDIYVCDPSADAFFKTGGSGTMDVYIFALGTTNERHVSWAAGSSNKGSITTSTGGTFAWGGSDFFDALSYGSDISFLHWSDPDGLC